MSLLFGLASGPDLLRLIAVPVLGWAALRDVRTRRVPNRAWLPLVAVGLIALAWDALLVVGTPQQRLFVIRVVLSLGLVAPLGYVFWRLGGFGGADAKAVMTLALVFPANPSYYLPAELATATAGVLPATYPAQTATLGVFSLTILSNTVLLGLAYPLLLAVRNLPRDEITPAMFIGRPVRIADVPAEYGRLLETPEGFTRRGLDVDALRMYLRWRGVDLATIRANPDRYRHPLPTARNDPGDGSIVADDRAVADGGQSALGGGTDGTDGAGVPGDESTDDGGPDGPVPAFRPLDTWGADRFLDAHRAYGATPRELREGLEVLVDPDRESVWLTPGIPFLLPMFAGLLLAVVYGDLLFAILSTLGLA